MAIFASMAMQYKKLGRSDLEISRIGFGCMSLHKDDPLNESILHRAIDLGINYFDTADLYDKGLNEEIVGRALKKFRNKVIIASKAGNEWRADGTGWDWNPRKEYILECAEKSLRRLQVDHIDLFQCHGGTINDPIDETIEAFEILKQQGKIRYYGLSSIRPNVIREWIRRSNMVSVMIQFSLLDRRPEESCLPLLLENDIAVLTRGSVAQGLLVDKPAREYLGRSTAEVEKAAAAIRALSGSTRSAAQTAVQFVLHHPSITSAIVGIRTMQQLEEAAEIFDKPFLSEQEYAKLQADIAPGLYSDHR